MTPEALWNRFKTEQNIETDRYEAWAFGSVPDQLLALVLQGEKVGTASPYDLYPLDGDELPRVGDYSVLLDSAGAAHCIIQTTRVRVIPFDEVPADHAAAEGEGDKSLAYWRTVHEEVLRACFKPYGVPFTGKNPIVCEEFKVVYRA